MLNKPVHEQCNKVCRVFQGVSEVTIVIQTFDRIAGQDLSTKYVKPLFGGLPRRFVVLLVYNCFVFLGLFSRYVFKACLKAICT